MPPSVPDPAFPSLVGGARAGVSLPVAPLNAAEARVRRLLPGLARYPRGVVNGSP
jgi:hypothetical protein